MECWEVKRMRTDKMKTIGKNEVGEVFKHKDGQK